MLQTYVCMIRYSTVKVAVGKGKRPSVGHLDSQFVLPVRGGSVSGHIFCLERQMGVVLRGVGNGGFLVYRVIAYDMVLLR